MLTMVPDDLRDVVYDALTSHIGHELLTWKRARMYVYYTYTDPRPLLAKIENWLENQKGLINLIDEIRVTEDPHLRMRACRDFHPESDEGGRLINWHKDVTRVLVDSMIAVQQERDQVAAMLVRNDRKEWTWEALQMVVSSGLTYAQAAATINHRLGRTEISDKMVQREARRLRGRVYLGPHSVEWIEGSAPWRPRAPRDLGDDYRQIMGQD